MAGEGSTTRLRYTIDDVIRVRQENGVETKQAVRALLDRLPDDCSVEDVLYHLYVLQAIESGQADVAAGRTIPHEEVDRAMRQKWLRANDG